jgi:cbb3-type cytochrome oxidase maturation protein
MNILFILIPISLIVMAVAIAVFLWAIRSGQYEDLEGPAHRILMDDDDPLIPRRPDGRSGDEPPD